jgi:hypothetical protein
MQIRVYSCAYLDILIDMHQQIWIYFHMITQMTLDVFLNISWDPSTQIEVIDSSGNCQSFGSGVNVWQHIAI